MNNKFLNVQNSILELMEDVRQQTIKEMEQKYESSSKVKADDKMYYTTKQTLKILGKKSVNTLKHWIDKGYIKEPKKIGRYRYYDANDIDRLLKNGTE